jgi:1-acyl-sn-glycerol-3-phosphate acyltransferase
MTSPASTRGLMDAAVARLIVGLARLLGGAQCRWVGCQPNACQRVYFANHSSHLDFVVLWSALPTDVRRLTRPVAARDYWERSRFRRYLAVHVFRAVLVDRGRSTPPGDRKALIEAARRTVEQTAAALGTRHSLILFPEGTRGDGIDVAPFKSGLYYLCQLRPDLELVPTYLENLNRILPRGAILPVPVLGSVTFGPPLRLEADEGRDAFLARARAALLSLRRS